nr:MAG TPA: Photosystem II reaction center protein, ELECTRON TRANSPORT [Caudoviricetes sp.]
MDLRILSESDISRTARASPLRKTKSSHLSVFIGRGGTALSGGQTYPLFQRQPTYSAFGVFRD